MWTDHAPGESSYRTAAGTVVTVHRASSLAGVRWYVYTRSPDCGMAALEATTLEEAKSEGLITVRRMFSAVYGAICDAAS